MVCHASAMVKVIAHRGASAAAPENTLEAFRLARDLGADWVELDARRSADRQLVVHHDATLADGRAVCDLARSALPPGLCGLADALDACAGMAVNIEVKNFPGEPDFDVDEWVARAVVELVAERGDQPHVLVSSFHRPTIDLVHRLDPTIATAMLGYGPPSTWGAWAEELAEAGHRAIHPWYPLADAEAVAAVHAAGLEVNVWTVNDPEHMAELVDRGVDGLCTDVPDVARRVVG
jgi:glycerophosphoryl diester phosphodiesterase